MGHGAPAAVRGRAGLLGTRRTSRRAVTLPVAVRDRALDVGDGPCQAGHISRLPEACGAKMVARMSYATGRTAAVPT